MKIHSVKECEKWIVRKPYRPSLTAIPLFNVEPNKTNKYYITWHVADIGGKSFQHEEERIVKNVNKIIINYPKIKPIIDKLHIYMCPKPSADTCNACANGDYVVYFARSTQIPTYMTDYITAHELGHCVNFKLCPDFRSSNEKFRKYLELRNAPKGMCHVYVEYDKEKDEDIYEDREDFIYLYGTQEEKRKYHGEWDTNPLEWFAEDFRYLFGCEEGYRDYWGHKSINPPDEKIREFFMSL